MNRRDQSCNRNVILHGEILAILEHRTIISFLELLLISNLCCGPFLYTDTLIYIVARPARHQTAGTIETETMGIKPNSYARYDKQFFSHCC